LFVIKPVFADTSIDVSARVGETTVNISGFSSLFSVVTFMENGDVIGTTATDTTGFFAKQFTAQIEGFHTLNIFANDGHGKTSRVIDLSYVLITGQQIDLNDLYLPPTINAGSSFHEGDIVNVFGYTVPNQGLQVNLTGKKELSKTVTSDVDGYYSTFFNTQNFELGSYTVYAVLNHTSLTSTTTSSLGFEIFAMPTSILLTPTPSSAVVSLTSGGATAPIVTPVENLIIPTAVLAKECPYDYINLCFLDKEKKGWIDSEKELPDILKNLSDQFRTNTKSVYDINQDGLVDEKDFSIILFHTKTYSYELIQSNVKNESGNLAIVAKQNNQPVIYIDLLEKSVPILILPFGLMFIIRSRKNKKRIMFGIMALILIIIFLLTKIFNVFSPLMQIQSSSSPFVRVGQSSYFDIKFDTGMVLANVVSADISFDPSYVEIESIDTKGSFANVFLKKDFSNAKGNSRIVGGLTGFGFSGDNGVLARVNFVPLKIGKTKISFVNDSKIVEANGKGDTIYTKAKDFELEIR
jgi:hypothetical protein